jgi:NTP pyrophosphatase (non-canonical NTP hydrolase)
MDFDQYQREAHKTSLNTKVDVNAWIYPALGLGNEAGEVQGKLKKLLRDHGAELDSTALDSLKAELGDVLWYVAELATQLGLSLDAIAKGNIEKLSSRAARNTIQGSGDNR